MQNYSVTSVSPSTCSYNEPAGHGTSPTAKVNYRSIAHSALSEQTTAVARHEPPGSLPRLGHHASPRSPGFPLDAPDSHSSSGTAPASTPPALLLQDPRFGASAPCRRRRLAARASSQLRASPEMEAGVARRLNGRPSLRFFGREAGSRGGRAPRCLGARCCGGAVGTNTTCTRIPVHCSASSSRTPRPPLPRRS